MNKILGIYEKFLEKEAKSNYNNAIFRFINNIIKFSLNLKKYPIEDRDRKLHKYLSKVN